MLPIKYGSRVMGVKISSQETGNNNNEELLYNGTLIYDVCFSP